MRVLKLIAAVTVLGAGTALAQNARPGIFLADADCVAVAADSETSAVLLLDSNQQLFVSTSDNAVQNWNAPVRMDDDSGTSVKAINSTSLQVVGSNVMASWLDDRDGTNSVWFNYSQDGGATWIGAQRIDDGTPAGGGIVRGFRMAVTSGGVAPNVYFLLRVKPPALAADELRLVANDGTSIGLFLPAVGVPAVVPQVGTVNAIDLCAEGNTVHAAWEDNRLGLKEVWYQRSSDRGQTWQGSDLQLTAQNDQSGDSDPPVGIACNGATVAVVWEERQPTGTTPEIRVAISTDGGVSFGSEDRVGDYGSGVAATTPDVVVFDSGNVTVGWQDARNGTTSLYASTLASGDTSFGTDILLSPSGGTRVKLIAAGSVGVGCWVSGAAKSQGAYSLDDGITWKTLLSSSTTNAVLKTACALNPQAGNFGTSPNVVQAWVEEDPAGADDAFVGGYSPCGPATIVNRNDGINPQSYTAQPALLGGTFDGTVDLSTTNHAMAALVAYEAPLSLTLASGYVLLVDVTSIRGELLGSPLVAGPMASFSFAVPNDPSLCEFDFYSQAVHIGGVQPFALSNAQDGVINAF